MTRERGTYRLVDEMSSGVHDDAVSATLSRAIAEHGSEVQDNARITVSPLSKEESLWMSEMYDHVAAYVVIDMNEFLCGSEGGLLDALGKRLSVVPLERIEYYIVWGKKRSLAVYVKGKLAT